MNVATYQSGSAGLYNEIHELRAKVEELELLLDQTYEALYSNTQAIPIPLFDWYQNLQNANRMPQTQTVATVSSPKAS